MGLLVITNDFTGIYKVSQSSFSSLDEWITANEKDYLRKLLGVELFNLFEADVDGNTKKPVTAKYLTLYDPIYDDDAPNKGGKGMKHLLLVLLKTTYIIHAQSIKQTSNGNVTPQTELSSPASLIPLMYEHNAALEAAEAIQWYINENSSDYPEYEGEELDPLII